MTRGRYPAKAIDKAKKIAGERGEVRYYARNRGLHPHFSIVAPHLLAEVMMVLTKHIGAPLAELEADAADEIGCMKMYPASLQISREIWFSSQNYFRRYFWITATGLTELSPDGNPLPVDPAQAGSVAPAGAPAPASAATGARAGGSPGSPQFPAQEYPAVPVPAPAVPVPESSGPASPAPAPVPGSPGPAGSPAQPVPAGSSALPVPAGSPASPVLDGSPAQPVPAGSPASLAPAGSPAVGVSEEPAHSTAHPARGTPGRGSVRP